MSLIILLVYIIFLAQMSIRVESLVLKGGEKRAIISYRNV